jgi:hypothetical protein
MKFPWSHEHGLIRDEALAYKAAAIEETCLIVCGERDVDGKKSKTFQMVPTRCRNRGWVVGHTKISQEHSTLALLKTGRTDNM